MSRLRHVAPEAAFRKSLTAKAGFADVHAQGGARLYDIREVIDERA
jgi:hypothetical protein